MGRIVTISLVRSMSIANSSPPILNMTICRFTGIYPASTLPAMNCDNRFGRIEPTNRSLVGSPHSHRSGALAPRLGDDGFIRKRMHEVILDLELRNCLIELLGEAHHALNGLGGFVSTCRCFQRYAGYRLH